MKYPLVVVIASMLSFGLAGCGDSSPLSGGALTAAEAPLPDEWTAVAADNVVQLETNPDDPYSVNLWVIGQGPNLYVYRGTSDATWVDNIKANPAVRIQIGESVYALRAERVEDDAEFSTFADAWESKYGSDRPQETNPADAYLYRLVPRS
ncbi:MAG: nitroreductase/quinone reductase family protein [Pseudomonadota bacterium]